MKKLFLFASAAAVLATSCSDDLGLKNPQAGSFEGKSRIIATYPLGDNSDTRTVLVPNEAGTEMEYEWSESDAIGVFGMKGGVVNAQFKYEGNNQFSGSVDLINGDQYYGYYPMNPMASLIENGQYLEMYIRPQQNYNATIIGDNVYDKPGLFGSFSQGEAPAVAWGKATEGSDGKMELNMAFQPLAQYFVFPVSALTQTTVKKLELSVVAPTGIPQGTYNPSPVDDKYFQYITGAVKVDMLKLDAQNGVLKDAYGINSSSTTANPGTTITLNCGTNGVNVGGDAGVANFWFVLPAGIYMNGATVNCVVTYEDENGTMEYPIVKTLSGDEQGTANNVTFITAENKSAWTINNVKPGYFAIQTEAQFVEYAYLVTNGVQTVVDWAAQSSLGANMQYSSLPQMLNYQGTNDASCLTTVDITSSNVRKFVNGPKNAFIAKSLDFNNNSIEGLEIGDTPSTAYYKLVYEQFLEDGSIPTIGGGAFMNGVTANYIIEGDVNEDNEAVVLKNLKITSTDGNALLYGAKDVSWGRIVNLSFNNLIVNYPEADPKKYYALLAVPSYSNFDNVTVNGGNITATSGSFGENMKGLFVDDYSSRYFYTVVNGEVQVENVATGVTNNSGLQFANLLTIDKKADKANWPEFYFTFIGQGYNNYNKIVITDSSNSSTQNGTGALLHISGQGSSEDNAAALMAKVSATQAPKYVYSVVDETTSYWTGMISTTNVDYIYSGSAEKLARATQYGDGNIDNSFTKNGYDLNLMGSYNTVNEDGETVPAVTRWWNVGNNLTVGVSEKDDVLTISNVYIDGTKDGETLFIGYFNFSYLNLFGLGSTVNDLVVDNITIEPTVRFTADNQLCISILSSYPNGQSSNITVKNLTENITLGKNKSKIGGLYYSLNEEYYNYLAGNYKGSTADYAVSENTGNVNGASFGYLAGELTYNIPSTQQYTTIVNPLGYNMAPLFGSLNITIDALSMQSTYITLTGFGNNFINEDTIEDYITVKNATGNYIFSLTQDGVTTMWTWDYDEETFTQYQPPVNS